MINTKLFLEEWNKISFKLEEISNIPKLYGDGDNFEGISIDEAGVSYKSSYSCGGCGTDYFDFYVEWDEINQPIEYFQEKYQKEIDDDKQEKLNLEKKILLQKEERERKEFERLKEKFNK